MSWGNANGLAPRQGKPRAYNSWHNMIRRCTRENDPRYPDWGGRGITIDPRWRDFAVFLADMGERPPGLSLERKDNDGPYCRENCVWATPAQQARNKKDLKLTPAAVTQARQLRATGMSLQAIGDKLGLHYQTVSKALASSGLPAETMRKVVRLSKSGMTQAAIGKQLGLNRKTVSKALASVN